MTRIRLDYVHEFTDRNGKVRRYFRRDGKRTPLPGLPGSAEFMAAYEAALVSCAKSEIGSSRTRPGTINALIVEFYKSAAFTGLRPLTKSTYRNIIERFRADHGDKRVATLQRDHVRRMVDARAETPVAANHFLEIVRRLMRFATEELAWRPDDPTTGIKKLRITSSGYHSWTEEEIAAFEARHPLGTKPRLALDLLLYTAQRRSDIVRLGRQHLVEKI